MEPTSHVAGNWCMKDVGQGWIMCELYCYYLRQGGYVFASVSLCVCLCVCVSVCHQDYAKSY